MRNWIIIALLAAAAPAGARDFSDPSWPCIQRKVERLSLGVLWPLPPSEVSLSTEAEELAETLALRRISLEEAQALVDTYAAQAHPPETYTAIFSHIFTKLDRQRSQLISGIGRFSLSQVALSEKIATLRHDMDSALEASEPNYDEIDKLEETLDWSERIFKDRQSVVTYVCESPVLLEQRLYALGQMLLAKAQEG